MRDNYPSDIRSYDNDPRSPFYEEPPECDECGSVLTLDVDCDEDGTYQIAYCEECEDE